MKKKYTKKQICEAIAYWKKQLKAGNYKKIHESTGIDQIKYSSLIVNASEFIAGLRDDSPDKQAVFILNALLDSKITIKEWVWTDKGENERILPPTIVDLIDVCDKHGIDIECTANKIVVKDKKVLVLLNAPYYGSSAQRMSGMTVSNILVEVQKASPDAEITIAFKDDPFKEVKVLVEFLNDAQYGLYPEGYGKNSLKLLEMPEWIADDIFYKYDAEIMDKYVKKYIDAERREAEYDRYAEY